MAPSERYVQDDSTSVTDRNESRAEEVEDAPIPPPDESNSAHHSSLNSDEEKNLGPSLHTFVCSESSKSILDLGKNFSTRNSPVCDSVSSEPRIRIHDMATNSLPNPASSSTPTVTPVDMGCPTCVHSKKNSMNHVT